MKKIIMILMAIFTMNVLVGCTEEENNVVVTDGNYIMKQYGEEIAGLPSLTIEGDKISFSYDMLSSYLPYGSYTVEEDSLTMTSDDGKYSYVFQVGETGLIFQKDKSSSVELIDDSIGVKVTDKAQFILQEN